MRLPFIVLFLIALLPVQALAHAQLRGAEPADGTLLAEAPAQVVLRFNEPVSPLTLRWFAPDGGAIDVEARAQGEALFITPPADLTQGTQALSWRVVSSDGHPVAGTLVFSVGVETGAPQAAAAPVAWPAAVARALVTLTLALGVGGMVWAAILGRASPGAMALSLAAVPSAGLMLGAQAMDMSGLGLGALIRADAWAVAVQSPYGIAAVLAGLAGLIAAGSRDQRMLAALAVGLAALSFAVAGHAARAAPVALMGTLVFLHAGALILWAGALPGLVVALRAPDAAVQMERFSRVGVLVVAVLALTGAALVWRQVGEPAALFGTAYGRVLVAKLALVALVLALAARHRLALTPRLAQGAPGVRPVFARSLKLELGLMVAILALTGAFRLTPPPRALAALPETRAEVHLHGVQAMADIALIPGRAGQNRVEIVAMDGDFQPFVPRGITLSFSRPAEGLEAIELTAERGEDGIWRAGPVHLPPGGALDVVADVLITDFRKELIGGTLQLLP